jgi:hypothetical protein
MKWKSVKLDEFLALGGWHAVQAIQKQRGKHTQHCMLIFRKQSYWFEEKYVKYEFY